MIHDLTPTRVFYICFSAARWHHCYIICLTDMEKIYIRSKDE